MMLFNAKPISQIKAEKETQAVEPLLDVYEAIVDISEELETAKADITALKTGR